MQDLERDARSAECESGTGPLPAPHFPLLTSDFLLWQLADSAFPTGGFAHSGGLEAARQHGEVQNRTELAGFLETSLRQLERASLPLVVAAYHEPDRLPEWDRLTEAFLSNHVANRASRAQGKALLSAIARVFPDAGPQPGPPTLPFAHLAPVFGAVTRQLGLPRLRACRLFCFCQLRGVLAAAVRLNIVGPMEAQSLQYRLSPQAEEVVRRAEKLGLKDLAQIAPLIDLWQGTQDRLYSRLFQS
jgi:urease accessory protein